MAAIFSPRPPSVPKPPADPKPSRLSAMRPHRPLLTSLPGASRTFTLIFPNQVHEGIQGAVGSLNQLLQEASVPMAGAMHEALTQVVGHATMQESRAGMLEKVLQVQRKKHQEQMDGMRKLLNDTFEELENQNVKVKQLTEQVRLQSVEKLSLSIKLADTTMQCEEALGQMMDERVQVKLLTEQVRLQSQDNLSLSIKLADATLQCEEALGQVMCDWMNERMQFLDVDMGMATQGVQAHSIDVSRVPLGPSLALTPYPRRVEHTASPAQPILDQTALLPAQQERPDGGSTDVTGPHCAAVEPTPPDVCPKHPDVCVSLFDLPEEKQQQEQLDGNGVLGAAADEVDMPQLPEQCTDASGLVPAPGAERATEGATEGAPAVLPHNPFARLFELTDDDEEEAVVPGEGVVLQGAIHSLPAARPFAHPLVGSSGELHGGMFSWVHEKQEEEEGVGLLHSQGAVYPLGRSLSEPGSLGASYAVDDAEAILAMCD